LAWAGREGDKGRETIETRGFLAISVMRGADGKCPKRELRGGQKKKGEFNHELRT